MMPLRFKDHRAGGERAVGHAQHATALPARISSLLPANTMKQVTIHSGADGIGIEGQTRPLGVVPESGWCRLKRQLRAAVQAALDPPDMFAEERLRIAAEHRARLGQRGIGPEGGKDAR